MESLINEPIRILVVEDSPTQAESLRYTLEQQGYEVYAARNGEEALKIMTVIRVAIVISDIIMPEMDGFQLCKSIKSGEKKRHIPVILLTALSDPEDVLKGLECGADHFITKPYEEKALLTKIHDILVNARMRKGFKAPAEGEFFYKGEKYLITSGREQVLNLLLSTYELAVIKNRELRELQEKLESLNEHLEKKVEERTAELQKSNEALRVYATMLEQGNRDLEEFAYVASHDLQEPLRKVQTFADRLISMQKSPQDDQAKDYLERMQKSAGRMQALVLALLGYGRITSNTEPFTLLNLKNPVEEAVADLGMLCQEVGGRVEIGELPELEADPVQMRQLFQNLIANSLKYRGERKPLIRVHDHPSGSDPFCEIHVEDNGIGFDEAYLEKIFKPFERLHGHSAPYSGTGIGLAICRRIAERHGGNITARSKPGEGATFIIRLPKRHQKLDL